MIRPNKIVEGDYYILYQFASNFVNNEIEKQATLAIGGVDRRLEDAWYKEISGKSFKEWYPILRKVIDDVIHNSKQPKYEDAPSDDSWKN